MTANDGNVGTLRGAIEPHNFCHVTTDHAFMFSAYPIGPLETHVVAKRLVHRDAVEGVDYDVARLTHVWTETNMQDRDLARTTSAASTASAMFQGPTHPKRKATVNDFADWYCSRLWAFPPQNEEACDGRRTDTRS